MTTIPLIPSIDAVITFRGQEIPITYTVDGDRDGGRWANGSVTIDDRTIAVGGGWIDTDGSVEDYEGADIGDMDGLSDALGIDEGNEDAMDDLRRALARSMPADWPAEAGVCLAEDEGEYETLRIIRIGEDYYRIDANGGSRGAHGDGRGGLHADVVEDIDEREAVRLMLECGLSPAEAARRISA